MQKQLLFEIKHAKSYIIISNYPNIIEYAIVNVNDTLYRVVFSRNIECDSIKLLNYKNL